MSSGEWKLRRVDVQSTGPTNKRCMQVMKRGKNKTQKVVVGDTHGVVQVFSMKKGRVVHSFKSLPAPKGVNCVYPCDEKFFFSAGQQVSGMTKKGKEFFSFHARDVVEDLQHLVVHAPILWTAGEFVFRKFDLMKECGTFMSPDRIHDLIVHSYLGKGPNAVLACQDRMLRVMDEDDPIYEIGVEGAVTALSVYDKDSEYAFQDAAASSSTGDNSNMLLYGCDNGVIGCLSVSPEHAKRQWAIKPVSKSSTDSGVQSSMVLGSETASQAQTRQRGGIQSMSFVDMTKDGTNDLIVGRDNGSLEVYGFDVDFQEPSLIFEKQMGESITSVGHGMILQGNTTDLIVSTYSGKVIGMSEAPDEEIFTMGGRRTTKASASAQRLEELHREMEKISSKLEKVRQEYDKVSEEHIAVATEHRIATKMTVNVEEASYTIAVEMDMPIETVALECDQDIELIDRDDTNTSVVSFSPATEDSKLLATYRCPDSTSRLEMRVRTVEGSAAKLQVFIIPRLNPKTAQVVVFPIKPLSLHTRVHDLSIDRPVNTLSISGGFSLNEMHAWLSKCIPEMPEVLLEDNAEFMFVSTFVGTILVCQYRRGEATFQSDSCSSLAVIKDSITRSMTSKKMRFETHIDLVPATINGVLELLHPKLVFQMELALQMELLEGVKELCMQEEDTSFLSPDLKEIVQRENELQEQIAVQPRRLEFIRNIICRLYQDWHRLNGQNASHKVPQLKTLLENYSLEETCRFFLQPLY